MFQRQLSFSEAVGLAFKSNYCKFTGRASRSEYWWFTLFATICSLVLSPIAIFNETAGNVVNILFSLAILLPSLGLVVRRLHDIGRSGWWYLGIVAIELVALLLIGVGVGMISGAATAYGAIFVILGLIALVATTILLIIWLCKPSQPEPNAYGPTPFTEA